MKKISVLLILVMLLGVVSFTACGSSGSGKTEAPEKETVEEETKTEEPEAEEPEAEEPEAEEPEAEETKIDSPLVGTWHYEGDNVKETYTFNDDGTGHRIFVLGENKMENDFTYEIQDNKFTITYDEGDQQTDEFSVDGDKMHMKSEYDDEFDYVRQ